MERVALSLQKSAVTFAKDSEDFDQFGRSSFNRYYYAAFLLTRQFVREFEPAYQAVHSQLPDHLRGSIHREISRFRDQAAKRRDAEAVKVANQSLAAISSLASTLEAAYVVRVAADYDPETKLIPDERDRFKLIATSINEAHEWPSKVRTYIASARRGWRLSRGL